MKPRDETFGTGTSKKNGKLKKVAVLRNTKGAVADEDRGWKRARPWGILWQSRRRTRRIWRAQLLW